MLDTLFSITMIKRRSFRQDANFHLVLASFSYLDGPTNAHEMQMDPPSTNPYIADLQRVEPRRQRWLAQRQIALPGIRIQAQQATQQDEWRACCPGLGRTGDRVMG